MDYWGGGGGGGGGGAKGMLAPPLKLLGGLAPPLPTSMNCLGPRKFTLRYQWIEKYFFLSNIEN